MAYLAGLKIVEFNEEKAVVSVPFKFLNKNPFNSIYFACLAMAGELSTGVLAMMNTYKMNPSVSLLVVGLEAVFVKKAVGLIKFECVQGKEFQTAVLESIETGESRKVVAESIGTDEKGDQVAKFRITWSFKAKTQALQP